MLATLLGAAAFLAMMAGLFVPLEAFAPATPRRVSARTWAVGATLYVANTVLMQLAGAPLLDAIAGLRSSAGGGALRLVAVFVLSDLAGYWVHRAMHRVPLLWRLHAVHHRATSEDMTWSDAWRQHPLDFVLHGIAVGLPGALLGASLGDVASVVLLRKAYTTFLHANVRAPFGPFAVVLASPAFHAVHHSADARLYDTNFAGTFPLWDVLFGTHARAPREVVHGAR